MRAFTTLVSTAAPLEAANVDTDQILPARFLKSPRAGGYGRFLFHDLRFGQDGAPRPDFVLNRSAHREAKILVANANFGCGSSREGAVYALLDHGFRCVVAPSFNDIFRTNCLRNGLLAAQTAAEDAGRLRRLAAEAPATPLTVDLQAQSIGAPGLANISFQVEAFGKACLLRGLDDIAFTAAYRDRIDAFACRYAAEQPWTLAGGGRR